MSEGGFGSEAHKGATVARTWVCSFMLWTGLDDLGERVRVLHERLAARLRGPVMGYVGEAEGAEEGDLI